MVLKPLSNRRIPRDKNPILDKGAEVCLTCLEALIGKLTVDNIGGFFFTCGSANVPVC